MSRLTIATRPIMRVPIVSVVAFGTLAVLFATYNIHLRTSKATREEAFRQAGLKIFNVGTYTLFVAVILVGVSGIVQFVHGGHAIPSLVTET
jgi:sulfite exporter TauE/SafE